MKIKLQKLILMASKYFLMGFVIQTFLYTGLLGDVGRAQEIKSVREIQVDLDLKNSEVQKVFRAIESSTDFLFTYDIQDIQNRSKVNIKAKNITVADALLEVSKQASLKFRQVNRYINVDRLSNPQQKPLEVIIQGIVITGKVTSAVDGESLPGVNIVIKGTSNGTISDIDGNFKLEVPDENSILVFSSVGFVTHEVVVGNQTEISIAMEQDVASLEEIVVIGYGTQAKKDLTSAIGSVDGEELVKVQVADAALALQGRIPGVVVTSNDGTPGGEVSVRIRGYGTAATGGDNEPLYVIDGVPNKNGMQMLNPSDIESIDVLKDAAAASVYGVQAANGVVVITTKRGKRGQANITFDSYVGFSQKWKSDIEVLNPRQWAELQNESFANANMYRDPDNLAEPNPALTDPSSIPEEGTNFQDEVFQTGLLQDYTLGLLGGTESTDYSFSLGYRDEDGIIINSDMKRITTRANVNHEFSKWLKIGVNFAYTNRVRTGIRTNVDWDAVTTNSLRYPSYFGPRELMPEVMNAWWGDAKNPLVNTERIDNTDRENGVNGNAYAEIEFLKGLTFRTFIGINRWAGDYKSFSIPILWVEEDLEGDGSLSQGNWSNTDWNWDNTLNYSTTLGEHNINVIVGYSAQNFKTESLNASQQNFEYQEQSLRYLGFGDPNTFNAGSWAAERSLSSYFGRLNYDFKAKYLVQFVVRRDASSVFSEENRWGTFPAASLGWRVSEEAFMQNVGFISDWKFRGSYGVSGNQFIGDYYPTYSRLGTGRNYSFGMGNTIVSGGVGPSQMGNPQVTWEENTQWNVGMDLSLFDNRLDVSMDYYEKETSNMLLKVTLPGVGGLAEAPAQNVGALVNSGFEFMVQYSSDYSRAFKWSIAANGATLKNEVTDLGDLELILPGGRVASGVNDEITRSVVGQPISSFYTYVFDGIFQNEEEIIAAGPEWWNNDVVPGDIRFKDISGPEGVPDGKITTDDRTFTGNPIPDFTYGLNFTAQYKGFDFSAFFQGVSGNQIYSVMYYRTMDAAYGANRLAESLNRWTGEGSTNVYPRLSVDDPAWNSRPSDRFIFEGSYMRLRTAQLGYTLPQATLDRMGVKRLRIYLSGLNLFTITDYFGFDPEVGQNNSNSGNQDLQLGIDRGVYPQPRTVMLGVNLTF